MSKVRDRLQGMDKDQLLDHVAKLEEAFMMLLYRRSKWYQVEALTGMNEKWCEKVEDLYKDINQDFDWNAGGTLNPF